MSCAGVSGLIAQGLCVWSRASVCQSIARAHNAASLLMLLQHRRGMPSGERPLRRGGQGKSARRAEPRTSQDAPLQGSSWLSMASTAGLFPLMPRLASFWSGFWPVVVSIAATAI
ncbi:MAG: hypothetical protein RIQ75_1205 [Pseudomonadota bacterium]|jgi:hypothetical protein